MAPFDAFTVQFPMARWLPNHPKNNEKIIDIAIAQPYHRRSYEGYV
jgi:hypothetical protein